MTSLFLIPTTNLWWVRVRVDWFSSCCQSIRHNHSEVKCNPVSSFNLYIKKSLNSRHINKYMYDWRESNKNRTLLLFFRPSSHFLFDVCLKADRNQFKHLPKGENTGSISIRHTHVDRIDYRGCGICAPRSSSCPWIDLCRLWFVGCLQ